MLLWEKIEAENVLTALRFFSILLNVILKLLREKQTRNNRIRIKRMQKMWAYNLEYLQELLEF